LPFPIHSILSSQQASSVLLDELKYRNERPIMNFQAKGQARVVIILLLLMAASNPSLLGAFEKKVRVAWDYTHVFLKPDESSSIVETVEQGTVLSLLYGGKVKKTWYYICFKSPKTGITKSGYVLDAAVELLFDPLNMITIREDDENLKVNYAPRKFDEMQWGQSKKQILEMEGKPSFQERRKGLDIMRYDQKVINLDCSIEYIFSSNKLTKTRFSFLNDYVEKNNYLDDYRKIKAALIQKFGKPLDENMNWRDPSYKNDFSSWGDAVSLGHLEMNSYWLTSKTEISASLRAGNDAEISLVVEYTGLPVKELASKSRED